MSDALSPTRALSWAFDAIQQRPTGLIVGSIVIFAVNMATQCTTRIGTGVDPQMLSGIDQEALFAILSGLFLLVMIAMGVALLAALFNLWLTTGFHRVQADVARGGEGPARLLWTGLDRMWPLFCWYFLQGTINFGVFCIAWTPAIGTAFYFGWRGEWMPALFGSIALLLVSLPFILWFTLGLAFGSRWVTIGGVGAMEALERSWEMAQGRRLAIWWLFFLAGLVHAIGFLFCFIGTIFTMPVSELAKTDAWLRLKDEMNPETPAVP